MKQRVTIVDVAREAQVSAQTVSRVINNKGEISSLTRQRVEAAILMLGYRPSSLARGLVSRHTSTLGLLVPDITNPFFSGIARGVEDQARKLGYNIFVCNCIEDTQREIEMLSSLEDKGVDGVIVCSPRLPDELLLPLLDRHSASVVINRLVPTSVSSTICVDAAFGARLAVEHLVQRQRRKIGFLAGPLQSFIANERLLGYTAALGAAGITIDQSLIVHFPPYLEDGTRAAHALLSQRNDIDGLLCYNDVVAIGALQACAERGLSVPEKIALIGFDDIPFAAVVRPALTTLRVSMHEIGFQAARLLFERIRGTVDEQRILLTPQLIVRASAP